MVSSVSETPATLDGNKGHSDDEGDQAQLHLGGRQQRAADRGI